VGGGGLLERFSIFDFNFVFKKSLYTHTHNLYEIVYMIAFLFDCSFLFPFFMRFFRHAQHTDEEGFTPRKGLFPSPPSSQGLARTFPVVA
jgi:hypothetical protein